MERGLTPTAYSYPTCAMRTLRATLFLLILLLPGLAAAQENEPEIQMLLADSGSDPDHVAVTAAVLDYVEGLYEVKPDRIKRSVHPSLAKVGYWREGEGGDYREDRMSYLELVNMAGRWNADGHVDPDTAPKEILLLDVLDKTAVAKLTAEWGVDYLQLAKINGQWMIINVLWQSPPATL